MSEGGFTAGRWLGLSLALAGFVVLLSIHWVVSAVPHLVAPVPAIGIAGGEQASEEPDDADPSEA